mmetsp:Transcript_22412/g.72583  ORF Transcript_22412/g.72583 Transcript_22412/m.72583 type:complete len:115 (-) Transcript_22412:194-538(-)
MRPRRGALRIHRENVFRRRGGRAAAEARAEVRTPRAPAVPPEVERLLLGRRDVVARVGHAEPEKMRAVLGNGIGPGLALVVPAVRVRARDVDGRRGAHAPVVEAPRAHEVPAGI